MTTADKIKVLVVDDSMVMRKVLARVLGTDPSIEVVGSAVDAYDARNKVLELNPDVLTLDIEMPRLDGLSFLKILMRHHPLPVVMVSSLTQEGSGKAFEALEAGAVEVVGKPVGTSGTGDFELQLIQKVKSAAGARVRTWVEPVGARRVDAPRGAARHDQVIVIGASTGGVEALKEVLVRMPAESPPICIVQHIPAYMSARFAQRLDELCSIRVREAKDGDLLETGLALVAPGGWHMVLKGGAGQYRVQLEQSALVNYQRPSVDVLFGSAAGCVGSRAVGVLLTGMGKDGAEGMRQLKEAGAPTIAQNEVTCVVYGMPRAAIELGAVRQVLPLERIAPAILHWVDVVQARPQ